MVWELLKKWINCDIEFIGIIFFNNFFLCIYFIVFWFCVIFIYIEFILLVVCIINFVIISCFFLKIGSILINGSCCNISEFEVILKLLFNV